MALCAIFASLILTFASLAWAAVETAFDVSPLNTRWYVSPPPPGHLETQLLLRSPRTYKGVQGTLSFRQDRDVKVGTDLSKYVRRWTSEYSRYGLKLLSSKYEKTTSGLSTFRADIRNVRTGRLLRQNIFLRSGEAIIATCTDHDEQFSATAKECQTIVDTFHWKSSVTR